MNEEIRLKAQQCKSAEELLKLAKENNYPMTEEEAVIKYNQLHCEGEIEDDELDAVAGGSSCDPDTGDTVKLKSKYAHLGCTCGCLKLKYISQEYDPWAELQGKEPYHEAFKCTSCGKDVHIYHSTSIGELVE